MPSVNVAAVAVTNTPNMTATAAIPRCFGRPGGQIHHFVTAMAASRALKVERFADK